LAAGDKAQADRVRPFLPHLLVLFCGLRFGPNALLDGCKALRNVVLTHVRLKLRLAEERLPAAAQNLAFQLKE
jgi:hypothetical protein